MSANFGDDFFQDDDNDPFGSDNFNLDEPSFDQDNFDLPDIEETDDEEASGPSRTFVIIGILLAFLFVIIIAIVAALLLGGGDECNEACLQATNISATNAAISTSIVASETALSIQSTVQKGTEVAAQATATDVFIRQSTATQGAVNTAVAATQTAISRDATATQAQVFVERTETAAASITPTVLVQVTIPPIQGQLVDPVTGAPGEGIQLCVFRDDGDGVFEPTDSGTGDCAIVVEVFGQGGAGASFTATPGAATTQSAGTPTPGTSGANATSTPAAPTQAAGGPPSPTPESSGANPSGALGRLRPVIIRLPLLQPPTPTPEGVDDGGTVVPAATTAATSVATTAPTTAAATTVPTQAATTRPANTATTQSGIQAQTTPTRPAATATTGAPAQPASPTPEGVTPGGGGDVLVLQPVTGAGGQFVLSGLEPGEYFIIIGDETVPLNVIQSNQPQLFTVTVDGQAVNIVVEANLVDVPVGTLLPTDTPDPINLTETAVASATFGVGGQILTVSPTVDPTMPNTGLFTGEGDDVTSTDLLILALAGGLLVSIVVAARRMRSAI